MTSKEKNKICPCECHIYIEPPAEFEHLSDCHDFEDSKSRYEGWYDFILIPYLERKSKKLAGH